MTSQEIYYNDLLQEISTITIGISMVPIVIGFIKRKSLNKEIKFFWLYLLVIAFLNLFYSLFIWGINNYYDFFASFLTNFKIQNTYFLSILSYLAQIFFIGFFYSMIFNNIFLKRGTIIYLFCAIIIYLFIDGYQNYGSVNAMLIKIFSIVLSLLYLNEAFKTKLNKIFFNNPILLISLGLLLPGAIQIIFSLFANDLGKTNFILYAKFKILTNFIDFIGYFLFSLAFLRASKNLKII